MKTQRIFLTLSLLPLFLGRLLTAAVAAPEGAEFVDQAWVKAVTAGDLNELMSVYAKDAVMWLPGAPEAKGHDAIRKAYVDFLAAHTVTRVSFANTHYQTSGDLSVGWGDVTLFLTPKSGGNPTTMSGRFTVIARRENGKWVYVVDHASSPAPTHSESEGAVARTKP
jgi:uncharacterized protein (TIGR02246 family)